MRAVETWLADGKAQGWSLRTLKDRRQTLQRFGWWLEHEEESALSLSALTPTRIRAFLTDAREPVSRDATAVIDPRPDGKHARRRSMPTTGRSGPS
jgi:hypothetical protein